MSVCDSRSNILQSVILWTNKRIEYYKSDDLKQMQGSVNLADGHLEKRAIQRSDKVPKKKNKEMFGFSIATDTRTWHFAVREEQDREQWIYTLVEHSLSMHFSVSST